MSDIATSDADLGGNTCACRGPEAESSEVLRFGVRGGTLGLNKGYDSSSVELAAREGYGEEVREGDAGGTRRPKKEADEGAALDMSASLPTVHVIVAGGSSRLLARFILYACKRSSPTDSTDDFVK